MDYISLGNQYFSEANHLSKYISNLKVQLKTADSINKRDLRRRILMLYEIMYELNCTGKRLKEGNLREWNSYKH